MAKQVIKTRTTFRKSNTVDKNGRKHCKTCGAFIGNRGRKK